MSSTLKPAAAWPFPSTSKTEADAAPEAPAVSQVQPDIFVTVPEATFPSGHVEPAFLVAKFFASRGATGLLTSTADGVPVTRITYHEARKACADAGFGLLTLNQSHAIALNIAGVAANWTSGQVGEGRLIQGIRKGRVSGAQAGSYIPPDDERRGFLLSNGEVIIDAAGNLYAWLLDDVQGGADGVVAREFAEGSPAVTVPYEEGTHGVGYFPEAGDDWSGFALVRGGCWCSYDYAGVFYLSLVSPGYGGDSVGVRCTKPIGV